MSIGKQEVGQAIDVITKIIEDATGKSTDIARNIAHAIVDKPWLAALFAKLGSAGIAWIKAGGLTKLVADFAAAKQAGAGVKAAIQTAMSKQGIGVSVRGFKQAGAVGKAGSIGKAAITVAATLAAMQIAKKTVDAAAAQYNNKVDKFKSNPNVRTGWELFWETSIPVATYRWIEAAVKQRDIHATPSTSSNKAANNQNVKEQVYSKLNLSDTGEANKTSVYSGINYDEAANKLGMSTRPSHPIAENEWKKEVENKMKQGKGNHPIWYGKYKEYLTSNLNYGVRKEAGNFPIAVGSKVGVSLVTPQKKGVLSQAYIDGINAIYAKLRGSNTGTFNYDPEDVASYIEFTRGIRGLHRSLIRDIKLVNNIDPYVSQTPDVILYLVGYDAAGIADIKANRGIYLNEMNQIANAIEATMPAFPDMALYDRTDFVSDCLIEEGKGPKSCIYAYVIESVLGWDHDDVMKPIAVSSASFATKLGYLRSLINDFNNYTNPTYGTKTFTKIAGDMLKAYGNKAFRSVPHVELNERATVLYDEYLLHQLQNLNPTADIDPVNINTVPAKLYSLSYISTFSVPGVAANTYKLKDIYSIIDSNDESTDLFINTNKSSITGLESISLTRSCSLWKADAVTANYGQTVNVTLSDCGSDILTISTYYYIPGSNNISRVGMITRGISAMPITQICLWTQVDYMSSIQIFDDSNSNSDYQVMLDLDVYADLSATQLRVFNDTATLSLLKTVDIQDQVNFKAVRK